MAVYTHDFTYEIGSESVTGEMEFNVDGQASSGLDSGQIFSNLTLDQDLALAKLLKALKVVFSEFGSLTKIEINAKT